jgi:FkbM family methyltransferase
VGKASALGRLDSLLVRGRQWRLAARRAARHLGFEGTLDRAYALVNPLARRERRDLEHLRLLLAFSLSPDSNCIDIGAHEGVVTRELVRLCPDGRHIAYEPLPDCCANLRREFPEVDVRQAAVSNEGGEVSFQFVASNPQLSGIRRRDYPHGETVQAIKVRTVTLDADLPEGYVPDFIKIDVEGAERLVIEGAMNTLAWHRPIVFFEHGAGASEHYGTRPLDLYDLLVAELGMRIFDADGNGPYTQKGFDQVFTRPVWNFVARG